MLTAFEWLKSILFANAKFNRDVGDIIEEIEYIQVNDANKLIIHYRTNEGIQKTSLLDLSGNNYELDVGFRDFKDWEQKLYNKIRDKGRLEFRCYEDRGGYNKFFITRNREILGNIKYRVCDDKLKAVKYSEGLLELTGKVKDEREQFIRWIKDCCNYVDGVGKLLCNYLGGRKQPGIIIEKSLVSELELFVLNQEWRVLDK